MGIPELKAKKVARSAANAKATAAAEKKSASDKAALNKAITARAEAYEAEYNKVSIAIWLRNTHRLIVYTCITFCS